jgi:hypothetical protein
MTIKQKNGRNRHRGDDHGNDKTTLHVVFDVVSAPTQTP